ncbi:MAG: oligosaccharide flippase family protein [Acetatifactor sp.]|nr:oligosaccharide flippase family protein [Acetatifactor sp.]
MSQMEIKRKQIICYTYIIGIIGMISMGRLLGDNGLAYMAVAMEAVSIFSLLTVCGVSDVIARLQKNRRSKGQYKGVARMRRQLLIIQGVVGVLLTVIFLFLTDLLADHVFQVPYSVSAMKILAPVIVIQALEAVLAGYFQGSGSQMPSLVSAVLRQGFFLVFGSLFGKLLAVYGEKVSDLLKDRCYGGMYGAMGVALGMVAAELLALAFLFIIYMASDRKADEQKSQEGLRRTESMGDIVRVFYGSLWQGWCTVLPVLLAVVIGAAMYLSKVTQLFSTVSVVGPSEETGGEMISLAVQSANEAIAGYGSFFGKCFLLCLIFVLIAAARCFPVYGRLCAAVRRGDTRYCRDVASCGLHYVWVMGLYITVIMVVMAPQMATGFFPGRDEGVSAMLRSGSVLVLMAMLAIMFSVILLAYGERFILIGMLGIWLILDLVLQQVFVRISGYNVTGILYASMLAVGLLVAGLIAYCLWRERISTEYIRILGIPLIGAGIMGLAIMLVNGLLGAHMSQIVSLVVAALLGAVVYGAILVLTRNIREYEISILYGKQIRKLLERIIS